MIFQPKRSGGSAAENKRGTGHCPQEWKPNRICSRQEENHEEEHSCQGIHSEKQQALWRQVDQRTMLASVWDYQDQLLQVSRRITISTLKRPSEIFPIKSDFEHPSYDLALFYIHRDTFINILQNNGGTYEKNTDNAQPYSSSWSDSSGLYSVYSKCKVKLSPKSVTLEMQQISA